MKKEVITTILFMLLNILVSCSDGPPSGAPLTLGEKLQEVLDKGITLYKGKGISLAVIMPDGKIWKAVSGMSNESTPVNTEMIFSAGSITKTFTSVTIMQLAEEGAISLDDSLFKWLPAYPNIDGNITIRQLLNHTSGIYNVTEHPEIWSLILFDPTRTWTMDEIVSLYTLQPYFAKGTNWHYSNTGYLLLRMIIQNVTGSSISSEYRRRLFEPVQLESSFLAVEETLPQNIAQAWFDLNNDGTYDKLPLLTSFYSAAGGGVFCTAEDQAKWARALYHNKQLLSKESYNQMFTFYSPCPGEPLVAGYGLGVVEFSPELFNGLKIWGHGGNAPGYAAGCFYLPDYGISIGIMDNTEEGEAMPVINDVLSIIVNHINEIS